jgi:hypothetical protein
MFKNHYALFIIAVFALALMFPGWSRAQGSLEITATPSVETLEVIEGAPGAQTSEVIRAAAVLDTMETGASALVSQDPAAASVEVSAHEAAAPEKAAEEVLPPQKVLLPRPLAVMVENEPPARPQSGLYAAKVLYEIQAEEVTRFMGIYYDHSQNFEIGPIRSARHYFVDISTIFDAVYVHVGGSPMGLAEISERKINNINAIKGDRGFYRSSDRRIPHNLYAKPVNLAKEIERKKFRAETEKPAPFDFSDSKSTSAQLIEKGIKGAAVKTVHIPYSRGYRVSYEYDAAGNNFTRLYNNKPFKDHRNSTVVKADNVVIMRCNMHIIDSEMRHEMDLYEGGTCEIFMGGHHITGSWDRDRTSGVFKYYDADLNDVKYNPGNIIVHVISPNQPVIIDDQTFVHEKKAAVKKGKKNKKSGRKGEVKSEDGDGDNAGAESEDEAIN